MTDILLFATGIVVGIMNAIAGGGSLIGFPVLIALGISPLHANATGFLAMVPGQLTSAIGYRKYLRHIPKYYALLLIPCMGGAAIGSVILRRTSTSHFSELVPWLILLAVVLFAGQPYLQKHLKRHIASRKKRVLPLLLIGLVLLPLCAYGGYFGPGFGFILLAFLSFTSLNHLHQMNGLKNIAAVSMGIVSVLVLARGGFIHWEAGLFMAAGSVIGGYSGARVAQKVPSHLVRIVVIIIGVIAATLLAIHDYS